MQNNDLSRQLLKTVHTCGEKQFTGFIKIALPKAKQWYIYFLIGKIIWAQSNGHPLHRWKRHILLQTPTFANQINAPVNLYYEYWNYTALAKLTKQKQFPREIFAKVVDGCITEALFNCLQASMLYQDPEKLLIETQPHKAADMPFLILEGLQSWKKAQQEWQEWQKAGLAKLSPDWIITLKNPQALQEKAPAQTFLTLQSFAKGEHTFRDLSFKLKQPIIPIAKSILPYLSKQLLGVSERPDIVKNASHGFHPALVVPPHLDNETEKLTLGEPQRPDKPLTSAVEPTPEQPKAVEPSPRKMDSADETPDHSFGENSLKPTDAARTVKTKEQPKAAEPSPRKMDSADETPDHPFGENSLKPTDAARTVKTKTHPSKRRGRQLGQILYIDDSPADSRTMALIIKNLNYQYTNVANPIHALPEVIELRPKLIFLDLVMPIANGYEICKQIRRVSTLKKTPVIIVTSNDGIIDRVRAKIVGASDFISKPIKQATVEKILMKYLP